MGSFNTAGKENKTRYIFRRQKPFGERFKNEWIEESCNEAEGIELKLEIETIGKMRTYS